MMAGCISEGSRSLSDFARSAACERAMGSRDPAIRFLKDRVEELDHKLHDLVQQVADSVGGKNGSVESLHSMAASVPASYRKER